MRRFLLIFIASFFSLGLCAQQKSWVTTVYINSIAEKSVVVSDSLAAFQTANQAVNGLILKNYLLANIDSVIAKGDSIDYFIYQGPQLSSVRLKKIDIPLTDISSSNGLQKMMKKRVSIEKFTSIIKLTLNTLANNGYPFAEVNLQEVVLQNDFLDCNLNIKRGPLVTYDSVIVFGGVKLSESLKKHYLGIGIGDNFNESKVQNLEARIRALKHIEIEQKPLVVFQKNKASIILRLRESKANKINALVGFAPQSSINNNKLLLTGQADLALVNLTGNSEEFKLEWNSFLGQSQLLETELSLPFIPYLNLGTTLNFGLVKFDSNYLQTNVGVALNKLSSRNYKWSIFYTNAVTSLLSADTSQIRSSFSFPAINATSSSIYGVAIEKFKWENRINPWKGYQFKVSASAGIKTINIDNRIERVAFNDGLKSYSLYDSLDLSFNQYQTSFDAQVVFPLVQQKYVLKWDVSSRLNLADQIFFGDLYRLGGYKTLKGFDEQSLFANQYLQTNVEIRYRFNSSSNVFVFANALYYKNQVANFNGIIEDLPVGFGVGANINTGSTLLSLAYGYGIQKNNPLNLAKGKFHFGLVSYF